MQIGVDPRRAVAISGMATASSVIRLLDGSRDREQLIAEAGQHGVPREVTERILALLAAAGAVVDFPAEMLRTVPPELRQRLRPVLATASLAVQDSDGGASLLARRSSCTVQVSGRGPVAALVADLLTSSGLAVTGTDSPSEASQADLLVLVGRQSPAETAELLRLRQPYLAAYAEEAIGVVGPLVRPAVTACLRCIDLTKAERDPAWPLILAQLASRCADPPGCDAVLAASVAAQTAAQAVAFADRSHRADATANGTLELVLPSWQWRRRTWLPHPACACGSHQASQDRTSQSRPASREPEGMNAAGELRPRRPPVRPAR